ncbi:MAG: alpha/beta fold hydrolase [Gammaproteobacteria bacterium]|nr:alpha/beta fold hydrolase [Gammaproteobacteria bacterium]MCP4088637.1 alpha/beta fold hydrolase [Gammaproteobacteria bacterium]MCP4276455.1 alpha/beta fold hydrolase [Gammaproteobacteria bacterium]MCP4832332.1 alpha/beta fold hydrolase [Gammaproteobacteria bacterium]MCP4929154.1 alpha/beta fold hydrolase [Gammaproteobacteria bacterium]
MSKDTIILVHGQWMTGAEMFLLKRRLRLAGFHVEQFKYRMVSKSLEYNCERLAHFIREQCGQATHLIGHSLGGVLSLQALQCYPDLPIDKVVCLGSPLVDSFAGRHFLRFASGRAILGKTLPQAVFENPLDSWSGLQTVGVIAGTRSLGLGSIITQLPRPNDGMVSLAETCLPGIDDHLEINVGHTGLVLSAAVARQCVSFIRQGKFTR